MVGTFCGLPNVVESAGTVEYPGGSRDRGLVGTLRLGSNPQKPKSSASIALSHMIHNANKLRRIQWITRILPTKQYVSKMHRLCTIRQFKKRRDAAVIAEMAPSTFTHRMAGRRLAEDYGKTRRLLAVEEESILL